MAGGISKRRSDADWVALLSLSAGAVRGAPSFIIAFVFGRSPPPHPDDDENAE